MATYIEYTLDDGSTLLVETNESTEGAIKAADTSGNVIIKAQAKLKDALAAVSKSVTTLREELSELEADGVEVTFGIKTVGEAGLFAVCKASAEVNYEVKLTWTRKKN
jgi:NAD/NADP transhydrogenase beta subunit